jgi:hypothetical protein
MAKVESGTAAALGICVVRLRQAEDLALRCLHFLELNVSETKTVPEFTEGVCADGAAILMDGVPLTVSQILIRLERGYEAERIVDDIWAMFYGQNLQVANWHRNGDLEPIDKFFESNTWSME